MAWLAVIDNAGEELARFEVNPPPGEYGGQGPWIWGDDLLRQTPGLINALGDAIDHDVRIARVRARR